MQIGLDTSIQYVPRVGPMMASRLERLHIHTVRDLLFYIPFRYDDFSHITPIFKAEPGTIVTVTGTIESIRNIFTKNGKRLTEAVVRDATGFLSIVWFNQLYITKVLKKGDTLFLSGKIGFFGNKVVMESPAYELQAQDGNQLHTGRLVPIYSETNGVTSKWLRGRIAHLLPNLHDFLQEYLPHPIIESHHLLSLVEAIQHIHFPHSTEEAENAKRRLAFDELFLLMLESKHKKMRWEKEQTSPAFTISSEKTSEFMEHLPFTLTDDQKAACDQITNDCSRTFPMNRLLEGDVGSGKTVVAAWNAYLAFQNGCSSVLMAPTQILAEQHYRTIVSLLTPFAIPVHLVTGSIKPSQNDIASKKPSVFVGTHALLSETIVIPHVGVVIVDEQQRFGVTQRKIIRAKGEKRTTPHFLTMTATPIPRTLALTMYGNLDVSKLHTMPKGRMPIKTWVIGEEKRTNAYDWIRKELQSKDNRVFWVCPFIEESESISTVKAVKKEYETLRKDIFPDIPIGLLHGKLKAKEKDEVLTDFKTGKTSILVTTPVVEVGIDIKEATIMIIEGAERFGLSQLHQLRGRVGRGSKESYCFLFADMKDPKTMERLKILETVKNGPDLAEFDLKFRGEGDVFGIRQHGLPSLTLASLSDTELFEETQTAVAKLTEADPELHNFPLLREQLQKRTIEDSIDD